MNRINKARQKRIRSPRGSRVYYFQTAFAGGKLTRISLQSDLESLINPMRYHSFPLFPLFRRLPHDDHRMSIFGVVNLHKKLPEVKGI